MAEHLAKVIPLFKDKRPPEDSEISSKFWDWGQKFVEEGVNNLAFLVDQIEEAENEATLLDLIRKLKVEVASYPDR